MNCASFEYDTGKKDRLSAYSLISFYYLSKANDCYKSDEKKAFLETAQNILTSSEVLADIGKNHIIGSAYLSLMSGKDSWKHAQDQFKMILDQDYKNFVGLMGNFIQLSQH